jgi:hypothetical protein
VTREVDLVALSLLWTEGADRKPVRRPPPPDPENPDISGPDPRTLVDLDEVLALLEVADAGGKAADLRRRAMSALEAARTKGIRVVLRGGSGIDSRRPG